MVLIPSPSPTLTTLNRSGRIAFFAIDNRILYSSDSNSVGGFPVSLYKVTQGVFRLKTSKENLSLVWGLAGVEKKLQIRFNSVWRIRWLAVVRMPIYISCGKSLMCYNIMPFESFNIQRGISVPFSKCKIINNNIIRYELNIMYAWSR